MKTKDFLEKAIEFAQSLGMVENGANKKKKNVVIRKNISYDVGNIPLDLFVQKSNYQAHIQIFLLYSSLQL